MTLTLDSAAYGCYLGVDLGDVPVGFDITRADAEGARRLPPLAVVGQPGYGTTTSTEEDSR